MAIRLASRIATLLAARRLVLVRPLDEIGADRGGVLLIEHRLEGRHARVLHRTVEHDLVEEIVAEEAGRTQIRNRPTADRVLAMARGAISAEEVIAGGDGRCIGSRGRWVEDELLLGRGRRKRRLPPDLEC